MAKINQKLKEKLIKELLTRGHALQSILFVRTWGLSLIGAELARFNYLFKAYRPFLQLYAIINLLAGIITHWADREGITLVKMLHLIRSASIPTNRPVINVYIQVKVYITPKPKYGRWKY